MAELNATINKSITLKTYNQSIIEQLGRCTLKKVIMTNVLSVFSL